jgi:isopenicillin-N N-acyltransferase-like protein
MRIVDLAGSPGEIGLGHGVALAPEIDAHLHRWKSQLVDGGVDDVEEWVAELVRDSWYVSTAFAEAPHLVEEVDGIAEGAGISLLDAWFLQLMDESWRAPDGAPGSTTFGCTTFGVVNGLQSWSGQTMDLEPFRSGAAAMLRITPDRGASLLVLTMAGCVGLSGVSAAGFAVLVNALPQVPARRTGLPVALVVRTALAAPNVGAATSFVHDAPHATGQHYLVAGAEQLASFECSPVGVAPVLPGAPRLWHTNHPLVGDVAEPGDAESDSRWEAVRAEMAAPSWGRARSRAVLEAPPVCRENTFAAIVIEQSARSTEVWVTDGPPTPDTWQHVPWS